MAHDLALVDSNVLIAAVFEEHEHYGESRSVLERGRSPDAGLAVLPQNVAEFYAAVTNPKRVPTAVSPIAALDALEAFLLLPGLTLLSPPSDTVARLFELAHRRPVIGLKVYDLMLVAGMLGNGVTRIYTFNEKDFMPFSELEVIAPPGDKW